MCKHIDISHPVKGTELISSAAAENSTHAIGKIRKSSLNVKFCGALAQALQHLDKLKENGVHALRKLLLHTSKNNFCRLNQGSDF